MEVTVTVERASHLWIMFSAEAKIDAGQLTLVRAWINDAVAASPSGMVLTHSTDFASYACNFYYYADTAGEYNVMIQWKVTAGRGWVGDRILGVIALPA